MVCNSVTNDRNYWVANSARNVIGFRLDAGNAWIGTTVTSISFYLTSTTASTSDTFTFGIWNSSGTKVSTSAATNVSTLGDNGDPSTVKFTYTVSSHTLASGDVIGAEQTSTNSYFELGASENNGSMDNTTSRIRNSSNTWSDFSGGTIGFAACINSGAPPPSSAGLLLPPPVAVLSL
jgi:hypothetical protein